MALNVKVGKIGLLDMLKFANLEKHREKVIAAAPANEVVADYPINNFAKDLHPDFQPLVIEEIIDHGEAGAKTFVFKRSDGKPASYFRAGQYISLKLPIGESVITRPYSITSSPKWALDGKVAVTIKTNPGGFAADWILDNFKVGDEVKGSEGLGAFYYERFRDVKHVIALAGGSGITPFLSMAYAILDGTEDFNLTIIYGSKNEDVILFKDELAEITKKTDKVQVINLFSDEGQFITADVIKQAAGHEPYSIFICGPEAMYKFVDKEIEKLGLEKKFIRQEFLGATKTVWEEPGYPQEAKDKVFKLTVKQGPKEFVCDMSANEPILVAMERAGIKAPSRCRSGECGWCRSRVLSGDVYIPKDTDGRRWADIQSTEIHPCATFALSDITLLVPGEYY